MSNRYVETDKDWESRNGVNKIEVIGDFGKRHISGMIGASLEWDPEWNGKNWRQ